MTVFEIEKFQNEAKGLKEYKIFKIAPAKDKTRL
jgi:hypothetical protein